MILGLEDELANAVNDCTPDIYGYCNITLNMQSNTEGILNISRLKIIYEEISSEIYVNMTPSILYSKGTLHIFEFVISNTGTSVLNNVAWKFFDGLNNTVISEENISSISSGEAVTVLVKYDFPQSGNYSTKSTSPFSPGPLRHR